MPLRSRTWTLWADVAAAPDQRAYVVGEFSQCPCYDLRTEEIQSGVASVTIVEAVRRRQAEMECRSVGEIPDYSDDIRDGLVLDKCRTSQDECAAHFEELMLFSNTLEGFIRAEDSRMAAQSTAPPEEYEGWWLKDVVAVHLRLSYLASVMNAVAFRLDRLCDEVASIARLKKPEFREDVVSQIRKFLICQAGFTAPRGALWDDIINLYKMRNIVVHSQGVIPEKKKGRRFQQLPKHIPGLTLSSGLVELDQDFAASLNRHVVSFFADLHNQQIALCERP